VTQVFVYCRDAYVTTDIVFVAPEVSGPIAKLPISGNQKIDAGSVLFAIDPEPFELALQTQKAALDLANANLKKVQDQVGLATSEIEAKQAILDDAQRTRDRIVELSKGVRFRDLLWITLKKTYEVALAGLNQASSAKLVAAQEVAVQTAVALFRLIENKKNRSRLHARRT
jgi:multidrug resistance efflux pump